MHRRIQTQQKLIYIYIYIYIIYLFNNTYVVGVMKMGTIVSRVGIEPTSLAFQANVLTITPPRLSDVTTVIPPNCLCGVLPERSVLTTTLVPLEM